ncbi:MAG TPA: PAS domain-containing sensor histidine kinase, partial [Actinomycetes bacterium]|nr:PAS domain-containing sensor histidine kinase [Actinomycetes bacterium]
MAADDAVGLPSNELLAGHDHDGKLVRLEDLLAAATPERPRASAEVQIRTSEGLERWLRCNHSLLYEGGDWTTDVVIVHDVTRIRQAERAKTDFVAKRADHLARLVEDLLLASRISSEPGGTAVVGMQRECTDLAEAARRAAADWRRGPDSRLELELPSGPLEVDADPLRLVQVLANLLSNAHKYSPPDQEVRLRVWRDGGWAMAAVADRGRGIPPRGAGPGVREVPPGRGPDDHDHRRDRPRAVHRPRADQGHGRGDRGGQRPLARLDLHRAAAAGPRPRGRRGHRRRRARARRRYPAATDQGPAPRRPPLPLLVTLSPCEAVV